MNTKDSNRYTYDELPAYAQERARNQYRRHLNIDLGFVIDTIDAAANCLGIEVEDVYYSVCFAKGDYAVIEGHYRYRAGWRKALSKEFGTESSAAKALHRIGKKLESVRRRARYLAATLSPGPFGRQDVAIYYVYDAAVERDVVDALCEFSSWAYAQLRAEVAYQHDDAVVAEALTGCEFDENGDLV